MKIDLRKCDFCGTEETLRDAYKGNWFSISRGDSASVDYARNFYFNISCKPDEFSVNACRVGCLRALLHNWLADKTERD